MMQFAKAIILYSIVCLSISQNACSPRTSAQEFTKVRVLVVAGGHSYDTTEFAEMFNAFDQFTIDTLMQPRANKLIAGKQAGGYDVFVFYDMWGSIDSLEKEGYLDLLSQGKGFVFLHHSICSYQEWDGYQEIIGGKYYTERKGVPDSLFSTFMHDIDIQVNTVNVGHPVTMGVQDFMIHDEGYGNVSVNKDVEVLLTTSHPECSAALAWTHMYKRSKIVYIMLGHDKQAYANEAFYTILKNAINYTSAP